jgi:hypothetical protein
MHLNHKNPGITSCHTMSSRTRLLPSPELDGDFDPSVHLTPTRTTHQLSARSMKSIVQVISITPQNEIDMRDSSSPNGGPGRDSYIRDQSSPPFLSSGSNPLDDPFYPAISSSSPPSPPSRIFDMTEIAAAMEDDDEDDDLLSSTPPPMPPARAMYMGNTLESRHHPFQVSEGLTIFSPSNSPNQAQTSKEASPFTSTVHNGNSAAPTEKGGKRRRSRHVRSNFVLDGNFSFASNNNNTAKPCFERAATTPMSAMEQQQQRHQGANGQSPHRSSQVQRLQQVQGRNRAYSTPNIYPKF